MRIITNEYVYPPHLGEFIRETYIEPLNINLRQVAEKLDVAASTFSRLIKGEADVSPVMALKRNKAFGHSAESWLLMQAEYELWKARKTIDLNCVSVVYSAAHAF